MVGILLMIASIFFSLFNTEGYFEYSLLQNAIIQLGVSLFGFFLIGFAAYKFLPNTRTFKAFVLDVESGAKTGFTTAPDYSALVGSEGTSMTVLRPAGTAIIDGSRYDVVTAGDYIEKDTNIKVIKVEGMRIVVEKV
ncbi:MAG: hypothetical protein IPJ75_09210 [Ignavibacteriales bacterium]|nr:hypothetical protein [Ignavibacteriales bacterium]